jgi:predicted RNA binding protein YcfA (HicA-like mRNA interferase family)
MTAGVSPMKKQKLFKKVISGSDNVRFGDLISVVEAFGFRLSRKNGSHHIFAHPDVAELLNLQNMKGKAKAYQIRQFVALIEQYSLELAEDQ